MRSWQRLIEGYFLLGMTVVLVVVFWYLEPSWLNAATIPTLISQNAPLAIVAVAMTFSIISQNIDLSPGSMVGLAGIVTGLVYETTHSLWLAIAATFLCCGVVGLGSGLLVARTGLNAIIVTLATYIWARGLAVGLSHANALPVPGAVTNLMNAYLAGFSFPSLLVVLALAVGWYLLHKTRFGRYTFATGKSREDTRRAGVQVSLHTVQVFLLMGVMTAVATLVTVGQLGTAQPLAGSGLELDAIVAVIIGGSKLTGGEGSVLRTALGVLFIAVLNSGLTNLGLSDAYFDFLKGATLLFVIGVEMILRRRLAARRAGDVALAA